ncbi:MAG: hypothetical protein CVU11_11535 [Bacteroidetes bacterium HGW-Bacteroidetes-6]|jgi:hypothetical protein|nr:MAG: hypothetical protein CVU11_11535 [Bacteroidetes bacterium HGW-Bacteroidetes-6]
MKKLFFLLLIPLFFATSCNENNSVLVFKKKITYKVSGTATELLVTYVNEKGETTMTGLSTGTIPWKIEFKTKADTYVYLQAKNTTASGDVKVEILQGDAVLYSDNNDLPFGAATCSGFVK